MPRQKPVKRPATSPGGFEQARDELFRLTAHVVDTEKHVVCGQPDPAHISTSHIERSNLTVRMGLRRFTRLTNGFSKKPENLRAAVAMFFGYYNFVRRHQTTQVTPAMAAGVTKHLWKMDDLLDRALESN